MNDKIIFLKGKDCTYKVRSIRLLGNGSYEVYFNSDGRRFVYQSSNVRILNKISTIDADKLLVLIGDEIQNGVAKVDDYGDCFKITYKNGFTRFVDNYSLKLIGSCLNDDNSNERFRYFKTIASETSLYTEQGKSILGSSYEKIKFIREDSVLADFFAVKIKDNERYDVFEYIYPFGFNQSQKKATENALNNKISVIQGPPGTGKTQTILNLIANIIGSGKNVAIVSNNNSAIDNVYEKLQKNDVGFIAAKLGSVKNKQDFINSQSIPSDELLESWKLDGDKEREITFEINKLNETIEFIFAKQNKLAELKSEYESIFTEFEHFSMCFNETCSSFEHAYFDNNIKPYKLLNLWHKIENKNDNFSFIDKILAFLFCSIAINSPFHKLSVNNRISLIQKSYYEAKIHQLKADISLTDKYLSQSMIKDVIDKHIRLSKKIFRSNIAKKYIKTPRRLNYKLDDLWKNSQDFIKDYPVVLSTTYSLRNSLSVDYIYDYVIVDEASQVDLATFVLALSCAKNVVVVGDQKQLPNVIDSDTKLKDEAIFSTFSLPDEYMFSKHSALSSIIALFGDLIPIQLLREHYRCHSKIIGFCNKMYYDNQLLVLTPASDNKRDPLKIYVTGKGNHAREDHVNQRQIDVILNDVVPDEKLNLFDGSVGIVTPYRNQAKALNDSLSGTNVLAATVDKFQGRERDVMIISTVDNKITDFTSNPNRLNVAVSRAKDQLIVVTNSNDNSSTSGIDELVNYIRYNNYQIINSKVYSIFDNLYTSYYGVCKVKKARKESSIAEDLAFELLQDILNKEKYNSLGIQLEYPLKMLVNTTNLNGRELEFASNDLARVDFIIFRKTSMQPVLVIEVDGHAFHNNATQQERDAIKDKLLFEAGIPLLRLATTGSEEREKIISKLDSLL